MDIATIGIVGAGAMGRGIAQVAAEGGLHVLHYDTKAAAAGEARDFAAGMISRKVDKGVMPAAEGEAASARIETVAELGALRDVDLVVEAVVEDLGVKREVFRTLDGIVGEAAILATNTSSLSITEIAAGCPRPERIAGFHFFNPVPLMRIVEVIPGILTAEPIVDRLCDLAERIGHRPVRAADTPGFLVNHAGRGYKPEALRAFDEGVADHVVIDRILRDGIGFRMGPFELMDLVGLDVSQPVMEEIYQQFYNEPRFRPNPHMRRRMKAGLLGRKTGAGFYRYEGNRRIDPPYQEFRKGQVGPVLVAECEDQEARALLIARLEAASIALVANPEDAELYVVMPYGADCTGAALEHGFPPELTVAVDPCCALDGRPMVSRMAVIMTNPATDPQAAEAFAAALDGVEGEAVLIADSPGFVAQRVLANIVNVASDIALKGIATPGDIDVAVRLGLGYPKGPLEIGDLMGPRRVLRLLEWLYATTGDQRFRASLWLRRRALLGLPLSA